ncbi:hypothetical protein KUCAC02_021630, partial [Chaenocephalus aceratus]
WRELDSGPSGQVAATAVHADDGTWEGPSHVNLLLRTGTQASVHHNMFISSGCQ